MKNRRKIARNDIRVRGSYTLPKWLNEWLRIQALPSSRIIEKALITTYKIKNPSDK